MVEIDAASHGGVDDARDLRERAAFAPARDNYKIFIIDEAHMVTAAGFNALLKIVEEPPPHIKFIFATTEPDKVIGTIRSRTHHYPFRLIAPGTLIDYVQTLCDSEGVRVEPGVLPLVVRAGGGSVRDTLSILDQLIAGSEGDSVTAERAAGLLGFTHAELLDDVVAAFGAHDSAAAFRATDRVVQTGQDPRRFVEDLLERLRDLIVVSATTVDGAAAVFRRVPQDQLTRMFEQAQSFAPGELSRIADVVSAALDKMAGATAPRLQLELMIARVLVASAAPQGVAPVGAASVGALPRSSGSGSGNASGQLRQQPVASQQPAPQQRPAPAQTPASTQVQGQIPAQAPSQPQAPAQAQAKPAPNAAQTAASIREFLREDSSGAPASAVPATSAGASAAPSVASGLAPAEETAQPQPQPQPAARPSTSAPHPNEGAAKFGRPISAVLSSAQIESIGTETPRAAAPRADAPAVGSAPGQAATAPVDGAAADAAASRPAVAPQEEKSPSAQPVAETNAPTESADAVESNDESDGQPGFEDLLELWPDLLEEILERDREAWNAVRTVQPLGLDGDILSVGIANPSDLAAFKTAGAGPLRETIMSAVGISVRYVPKRLPAGGQTSAAPAEAPGGSSAPSSAADAEEPHRAGLSGAVVQGSVGSTPNSQSSQPRQPAQPLAQPQPSAQAPALSDDPVARAQARLNGLGPALAAPAWADLPVKPEQESVPSTRGTAIAEAPAADARVEGASAVAGPGSADPAERTSTGLAASDPTPGLTTEQTRTSVAESVEPEPAADPEPAPAAVTEPAAAPEPAAIPAPAAAPEPAPGAGSSSNSASASGQYVDDPYANDPYAGEPSEDAADDPYGSGDPYGDSNQQKPSPQAPDPQRRQAPSSQPQQPPSPQPQQSPSSQPSTEQSSTEQAPSAEKASRSAPKFTRYGEAVVREVLGARFVEERPLPSRLEA